jgi:uroporphyrinogen-III synthase
MSIVLITRPEGELDRILIASGFSVINCPVIETVECDDHNELSGYLNDLTGFDGVFVTSRHAAEILAKHGNAPLGDYRGRMFVLGRRSADILNNLAHDVLFYPDAGTADEMLDRVGDEALAGKRWLFVRGDRSAGAIAERLSGISDLTECIVYRTRDLVVPPALKQKIEELSGNGEIDIACFFSPSGVESFARQFGAEMLGKMHLAAIGKTTAKSISDLGFSVDLVPEAPTMGDLATAIIAGRPLAASRARVRI